MSAVGGCLAQQHRCASIPHSTHTVVAPDSVAVSSGGTRRPLPPPRKPFLLYHTCTNTITLLYKYLVHLLFYLRIHCIVIYIIL